MRRGLFGEAPPFTQLILVLFTMVACAMFFMFIGILLAPPILGIPLPQIMNMMGNGEAIHHLNLLRYMQTLQNISLFIIPALFVGYLFSGNVITYFGFRNVVSGKWFVAVFLAIVTVVPFINLLTSLNEMVIFPESLSWLEHKLRTMEDNAAELTKLFMTMDHVGWLFFNILMIAVLPAVGEELIFRGIAQKIFVRWTGNVHAGIIITAFLFSFIHLQFYGFFPRWLLGIIFGYMLVWSGSIWLPIFAHFLNNAMAVVVTYLTQKGYISEELGEYGSAWSAIPVTIVMTAACIWILWKMYKARR